MPRLLLDAEWFDPHAPNAIPANDYAELMSASAPQLYPDYWSVRVVYRISNPNGHAQPSFVLVDKHYRDWWAVVVAFGEPPGPPYVTQQARVVRAHRYDPRFIDQIVAAEPLVDRSALVSLCRREVPRLLVVVAHPPNLSVRDDNVRVGVIEIFESPGGRRILRINGDRPEPPQALITVCRRDFHMPGEFLVVDDANGIPASVGSVVEIEVGDVTTTWQWCREDSWLLARSRCPLPAGVSRFNLVMARTGRLRLIP